MQMDNVWLSFVLTEAFFEVVTLATSEIDHIELLVSVVITEDNIVVIITLFSVFLGSLLDLLCSLYVF